MHLMKGFFHIWDLFFSNGATLMHKDSLQMCHKYKYDLWGHNSSLCVLSDFCALSSLLAITFAVSMYGLDPGFEDTFE